MESLQVRISARSVLAILVFCISLFTSEALSEEPYQIEWSRQLGTNAIDYSRCVAVDTFGNAFISGSTEGSLGGPNMGLDDAYLAKYDSYGTLLWTKQFGDISRDFSESVAVDVSGNAWISGSTNGSLGGLNAGDYDAYLVKYTVPEPTTLSFLLLGSIALAKRRKRHN